jgi:hypothetical protein
MHIQLLEHGPYGIMDWLGWEERILEMPVYMLKELPATPEAQSNMLALSSSELMAGNRFDFFRAPFLENISAAVAYAFDVFAPMKMLDVFEIGPGVDFASTYYLPFSKIRNLSLMEVSADSFRIMQPHAMEKGWNLINDDIHTSKRLVPNSNDVFYSLSSCDGTLFLDRFFERARYTLKQKGIGIIMQDVFPDLTTVVGLEYGNRKAEAERFSPPGFIGSVPYGLTINDQILWVANKDKYKIPSHIYLQDAQETAAIAQGFDVLFKGVIRATRTELNPTIKIKDLEHNNHMIGHLLYSFEDDRTIPRGMTAFSYYINLLVVQKR